MQYSEKKTDVKTSRQFFFHEAPPKKGKKERFITDQQVSSNFFHFSCV